MSIKDYSEPMAFATTRKKIDCGNPDGLWLSLNDFSDTDDMIEACLVYFEEENEDEICFTSFRNIPENLIQDTARPDWVRIWEFKDLTYDQQEIVLEYWDEVWKDCDIYTILDRHIAYCDTSDMWEVGQRLAIYEDYFTTHNVDESVQRYFDYEAYAEDAKHDYYLTTNNIFITN